MASEARLSKLLFEARELIDMLGVIVKGQTGIPDGWSGRVRDEIDAYRAERGWSPHGFGGEEQEEEPMTHDNLAPATCPGALTCERTGPTHLGWHSRLMPNGTFIEWTDDGRVRVTEDNGEDD